MQPEYDKALFFSWSQDADSRCLSNFYQLEQPLVIDGRRYATVEHFYQAEKFRHLGDDASAYNFTIDAPKSSYVGWSGADAKRAAKPLKRKGGSIWKTEADRVMIKALDARACVDKNFVRVLLAAHSRQRQLRHYEPPRRGVTSYWGCARDEKGGFEGHNRLGHMLMDLAKRLADEMAEAQAQRRAAELKDMADAEAQRIAAELKKVERKLREIDQLKQRQEQGEQLEKLQLAKIDRETQLLCEKAKLDQESTYSKPDVALATDMEQPTTRGDVASEPTHVIGAEAPATCVDVVSEPIYVPQPAEICQAAAVPVCRRLRPRGGQSHFSRKYKKDHTSGGA